jgi:2-polyprenyl-6-methoxyphenol hydroxylase-like FAD-dependent oxidoreductase
MRIVIMGCGRTGSILALLMSHGGHQVTMIERSQDARFPLPAKGEPKRFKHHSPTPTLPTRGEGVAIPPPYAADNPTVFRASRV